MTPTDLNCIALKGRHQACVLQKKQHNFCQQHCFYLCCIVSCISVCWNQINPLYHRYTCQLNEICFIKFTKSNCFAIFVREYFSKKSWAVLGIFYPHQNVLNESAPQNICADESAEHAMFSGQSHAEWVGCSRISSICLSSITLITPCSQLFLFLIGMTEFARFLPVAGGEMSCSAAEGGCWSSCSAGGCFRKTSQRFDLWHRPAAAIILERRAPF